MQVFATVFLTLLLLLWTGLIVVLDLEFAASLHPRFFLVLAAVTLLIVACLAWIIRQNMIRIILVLFYILLLVILPFVDNSPVKPFTKFYRSIHVGMSDTEVYDLLVKHFLENGPYKRPIKGYYGDGGSCFILDPNDGRYNAEIIVVKMEDGKLSSKQYLPD